MTPEQEMEKFWSTSDFHKVQRDWMEAHWRPYQDAIRTKRFPQAQEIACSFFSGSVEKQEAMLRKHGIAYLLGLEPKKQVIAIAPPAASTGNP